MTRKYPRRRPAVAHHRGAPLTPVRHPLAPDPSDIAGVRAWVSARGRPTAIDLFAGAGGLSLGLHQLRVPIGFDFLRSTRRIAGADASLGRPDALGPFAAARIISKRASSVPSAERATTTPCVHSRLSSRRMPPSPPGRTQSRTTLSGCARARARQLIRRFRPGRDRRRRSRPVDGSGFARPYP